PTLTQARVTDVLQAGARYPSQPVRFDYQLGPGELDMEGARQALMKEQGTTAEADPSRSWYVLSSGYARPDASSPINGTIELRRSDGTIASGLDGSELAVNLKNGVLLQSITKVRAGLFRFAIAGDKGTGGANLDVDVTYAGVSLGTRELPIGIDAWETNRGIDGISGACHCRAAGRSAGDEPWFGAAIVIGVAALRRGSRAASRRCRNRRAG